MQTGTTKKTYDILRTAQVPGWIGLNGPVINGGTMHNTGWEFGLRYQDKVGELEYGIGANFQTFRNELTKFGAREIGGNNIREEGHRL